MPQPPSPKVPHIDPLSFSQAPASIFIHITWSQFWPINTNEFQMTAAPITSLPEGDGEETEVTSLMVQGGRASRRRDNKVCAATLFFSPPPIPPAFSTSCMRRSNQEEGYSVKWDVRMQDNNFRPSLGRHHSADRRWPSRTQVMMRLSGGGVRCTESFPGQSGKIAIIRRRSMALFCSTLYFIYFSSAGIMPDTAGHCTWQPQSVPGVLIKSWVGKMG